MSDWGLHFCRSLGRAILFVSTLSGCDTTSALRGITKVKLLPTFRHSSLVGRLKKSFQGDGRKFSCIYSGGGWREFSSSAIAETHRKASLLFSVGFILYSAPHGSVPIGRSRVVHLAPSLRNLKTQIPRVEVRSGFPAS